MMPLRVEGAAMDVILSPFHGFTLGLYRSGANRDNARKIDPRKTRCGCQMSDVKCQMSR